jgi:hypothetical protein
MLRPVSLSPVELVIQNSVFVRFRDVTCLLIQHKIFVGTFYLVSDFRNNCLVFLCQLKLIATVFLLTYCVLI